MDFQTTDGETMLFFRHVILLTHIKDPPNRKSFELKVSAWSGNQLLNHRYSWVGHVINPHTTISDPRSVIGNAFLGFDGLLKEVFASAASC